MRKRGTARTCLGCALGLLASLPGQAAAQLLWGGSLYEYVPTYTTWNVAKAAAESMSYHGFGGRLATITSAAEQAAVASLVVPNTYVMLGASDAAQEGTWRWETGPEAGTIFWQDGATPDGQYANWRPGEPNNVQPNEDYLVMYQGGWNDSAANAFLHGGYLVEYTLGSHGFDFAMTNDHLGAIRNLSPTARLVGLDLRLAGDTFIDAAATLPGTEFSAWSLIDASPGATWVRPNGAITDGSQAVTLELDLAPLDELHFQVDLDRASAVDGPGIAAGTMVTAFFELGSLRYAVSGKVGATEATVLGTTFPYSARGMLTSPVPVPASWLLFGTGLVAVVRRMRRAA